MKKITITAIITSIALTACGGGESDGGGVSVVDLGITAAANADANSSYENSKADIYIAYSSLPRVNSTYLKDAIAYLDADNDGDTDVFLATGEYLLTGEVDSELYLNDSSENFTANTSYFSSSMPPATHARKSLVSDFNNDTLQDILVLDHGYDANPFPGNVPKLIIQDSAGSFSWSKLTAQTGFHHGGAAADIDNDGDIDVFVGGFDPFFFINDGSANFTKVDNRFDKSIDKIFNAELIDVDEDGFVDLLVGAHERDGDKTSVYWGSTTGSYSSSLRTVIPAVTNMGAVLDFEAEDVNGDGRRDLIINRTRDGDDGVGMGFYMGRRVQLLFQASARSFTDVTATNVDDPGTDADAWFPWMRAQDVNSDTYIDFGPDDAGRGFGWLNDGTGNFTKTIFP